MTPTFPLRRGRTIAGLGLVTLALSAGVALAATAGELDPSFDDDGRLVLPFKITPGHVLPQADGKILVTDEDSATVVRLNADGSLDRSYGGDGIVTGFSDDAVSAAVLQPDGKLVVAGATAADDITVARLDTDGSLDESFGPGGPDGDGRRRYSGLQVWYADAMVIQPDGRIAIAGQSSVGMTFARLEGDGTPEGSSFEYGGEGSIRGAALAPDGGLVIAAYAGTSGSTDYDLVVTRFKTDGKLDASLGGTGRVRFGVKGRDDVPAGVVVQPDGKIVIAEDVGTSQPHMTVLRLTAAGALDTTLAGDGTATPEFLGATYAAGAALQPDGKILLAGTLGSEQDFIAARFDPDGSPDPSFGTDGRTQISFDDIALGYAAGLQPDGKLVVAGLTAVQNRTVIRTAVARVLADQPPAQPGTGGGEHPGTGVGGQPGGGPADRAAPVIGRVTLAPAKFAVARRATANSAAARGTRIRFTLSEPASVTLRIERAVAGRRAGGHCRPVTKARKGRPCRRYVKAGTLRRTGVTGANRVAFSGRIGRKALRRGAYHLIVGAVDATGNRSSARPRGFRIVR